MGGQGVGHVDATVTQVTGGGIEIDGVPQDDSRDDQVEARVTCPRFFVHLELETGP